MLSDADKSLEKGYVWPRDKEEKKEPPESQKPM